MSSVNFELFGFDTNTSRIYNFLLHNSGPLLAKIITENLQISSKGVYAALKLLEQYKLIEVSNDYPKLFSVKNPELELVKLVDQQINRRNEEILTLKDEYEKARRIYLNQFLRGSCDQQVNFHYFRNNKDAMIFLKSQLENAQIEILINLLPSRLLTSLIEQINAKIISGIWVGIYLQKEDLSIVPFLDKNIKAFCLDSVTLNYVNVDNNLYLSSQILIDRKRFIDIVYDPRGSDWMLSSFIDPNVVEGVKVAIRRRVYYNAFDLVNKKENDFSGTLLSILKIRGAVPKSILSEELKLSGGELNKILLSLINKNLIRLEKVQKGRGRPQEMIILI